MKNLPVSGKIKEDYLQSCVWYAIVRKTTVERIA